MSDIITLNNIKIRLRKDALSAWEQVNPVLRNGELALAEDENGNQYIKVGNGLSSFSELPYVGQEQLSTKNLVAGSISQGFKADGSANSIAGGIYVEAPGNFQQVFGIEASAVVSDDYSFVWNGTNLPGITQRYTSHGEGTFSINPVNGLSGVYVGEENLSSIIQNSSQKVLFRKWTEV